MIKNRFFQKDIFCDILSEVYQLRYEKIIFDNLYIPVYTPLHFLSKKQKINTPFMFLDFINKRLEDYTCSKSINIALDLFKNENYIHKSTIDITEIRKFSTSCMSYIDIQDLTFEQYYTGLSRNFRQNIRKAENKLKKNNEFIIKTVSNFEELKKIYNLFALTYATKHKMVFHPMLLFQLLYEEKLITINYCIDKSSGEIMNAIVIGEDDFLTYYMFGMNHQKYSRFFISAVLLKDMIKKSFRKQKKYISFGATPYSDTDLLLFKAKWNCANEPIFNYYTNKEPNRIDLNTSYRWQREIFFKLPLPILEKIMPSILKILVQ